MGIHRLVRPIFGVATAMGLLCTVAAASPTPAPTPAPPDPSVAITLPRPTGPFLTGTARVHLRDEGRIDALDPEGDPRELMVQLWYPAESAAGAPLAPYAPPGETAALQAQYPVPVGAFTATTNSRLNAPVRHGNHRVVFFHHGLCAARTDTTVINEELASRGYVVVALASTHEAPAVEFPDGRIETTSDPAFCLAGGDPFSPSGQEVFNQLLDVRVDDTRFVLDQLARINRGENPDASGVPLPPGIDRSMNTHRVGMLGHSFGGATAAAVMHEDRRFIAGVNLDGLFVGPVLDEGLSRPFLVFGSDYHDEDFDPSWAKVLPRLSGWHRWFRLVGSGHYRFIDLGGSVRKWGLDTTLKPADPETWRTVFGDIDDALSQEIVVRVTTAFFERHLRHRSEPILDIPSDYYAELEDRTDTIG